MITKSVYLKYVVILFLVLVQSCDNKKNIRNFKRRIGSFKNVHENFIIHKQKNFTLRQDRGFFGPAGLFSLGKVLNFFPVGNERECQPTAHTIARAGICLNPYDCRQRDGAAGGDCAHGLGVCCVFEVTCGGKVQNNVTYFTSPGFPELWSADRQNCTITIDKAFAGITQLRVDFVHFAIGQPNRLTGECDEDAMILGEGANNFTVCGQNHGQHIYYTLSSGSETREAGELPSTKSTKLTIRVRGTEMPRIWLLRLSQMPLANSAPHNCLQYFMENNGTIRTFNYAVNGRHLASQDYRACVRRNTGFCAVRYTPCDNRSFRIGSTGPLLMDPLNEVQQQIMMPVSTQSPMLDEVEGSGAEPQIDEMRPVQEPPPSLLSMMWSYMWPSWLWGQAQGRSWRWSPYTQHYPEDKFRYYGYGNFGVGFQGYGRHRCEDRITIPCENEYFVSSLSFGPGVCDPHHCGNNFCPGQAHQSCRVETSITPFAISVHFGPPAIKRNPEENIGACLRYQQLPCDS